MLGGGMTLLPDPDTLIEDLGRLAIQYPTLFIMQRKTMLTK